MPHIAVTMLPGRDRETKQKLAENLCNTLIETLGVDAKFVSVSVEDVEMNEYEKVIIDSFVTADRPVDGGLWRR